MSPEAAERTSPTGRGAHWLLVGLSLSAAIVEVSQCWSGSEPCDPAAATYTALDPASLGARLIEASRGLLDLDERLSLLLAIESVSLTRRCDGTPHPRADRALREAMARSGNEVVRAKNAYVLSLRDVALSADGSRLVVLSRKRFSLDETGSTQPLNDVVTLWKTHSTESAAVFDVRGHTAAADVGGDGGRVLLGMESGDVQLLDVVHGLETLELDARHGSLIDAMLSPSARHALATFDDIVVLWDLDRGGRPSVFESRDTMTAAMSPDGSWVLALTSMGTGRLWRSEQPDEPIAIERMEWALFGTDGASLVTWTGASDAKLWNLRSERPTPQALHHGAPIVDVDLSDDGRAVATASADGLIGIWEVATGRMAERLRVGDAMSRVVLAPDATWVAAVWGDGRNVSLWRRVDSGGLFDIESSTEIDIARFSPNGSQLVLVGRDRDIPIFDLRRDGGVTLRSLIPAHVLEPSEIELIDDGRRLAVVALDGPDVVLSTWELDVEALLERACERVEGNLTRHEWDRYMGRASFRPTCDGEETDNGH